jgi:hypothetical protein
MSSSFRTEEKGSILIITLIIVICFGILIAGLAPFASSQVQYSSFLRNRIQARYIAEAGARIVIKQVENYIDNMALSGKTLEDCTTNGLEIPGYIGAANQHAFKYKYKPLTGPDRIRIQVSSLFGNLKKPVEVVADIYVDNNEIPNAKMEVDLLSSIVSANNDPMRNLYCGWPGYKSYYNGTLNGRTINPKSLWKTGHEPLIDPKTGQVMKNPETGEDLEIPYASPPNDVASENGGNNESRILFEERFEDGEVDFSYRFSFQKDSSTGGGPAVFYGVQDIDTDGDKIPDKNATAKNFTSYEVAFNRNSGSFAVNKKIADGTQGSNVLNDNDPKLTKFLYKSSKLYNPTTRQYETVNNYCPDYQSYIGNNSQYKNHGYSFQPNGTGLSTQSVTADRLKNGIRDYRGRLIKTAKQYADEFATNFDINVDKEAVDPLGNKIGRCSISWEMLEAVLRDHYKKLKNEGKTTLDDGITKIPDNPDSFSLSAENNGLTIQVKTAKEKMTVQKGDLELDCVTGEVKWKKTTVATDEVVMRHQVFIDGREILNFVDFNKYYHVNNLSSAPYTDYEKNTAYFNYDNERATINLKNSRSGFRIQSVKNNVSQPMKFYNIYSNATSKIKSSGRVFWIY